MRRESWRVVGSDARPGETTCVYCKAELGQEHAASCVRRSRTVVIEYRVEVVKPVPEDWDEQMINFHLNEGTNCADNEIEWIYRRMRHLERARGGCFCGRTHGTYLREATEWDEESIDFGVSNILPG